MTITIEQYYGEQGQKAKNLLAHVNPLLDKARADGLAIPEGVSGEHGGFRLQDCTIGAQYSSHKDSQAIDIPDPNNHLDDWLTDAILEEYGLYREHPYSTIGWCHLTTKAPASGHRTFVP